VPVFRTQKRQHERYFRFGVQAMNPETSDPAFHERLSILIGNEKPYSWAKRVGIPSGTFARIWNEKTVPAGDHLRRIGDATGVSLDWLLRGYGPMRPVDAPPLLNTPDPRPILPPPADARLIGRLTEKILAVYKEMGAAIAVHQAAERAVQEHNRIISTGADPEDRYIQVGEAIAAIRQELQAAAADPASSKHQA
jgi:transcriptional regulator with XRE-family HTH domain